MDRWRARCREEMPASQAGFRPASCAAKVARAPGWNITRHTRPTPTSLEISRMEKNGASDTAMMAQTHAARVQQHF